MTTVNPYNAGLRPPNNKYDIQIAVLSERIRQLNVVKERLKKENEKLKKQVEKLRA